MAIERMPITPNVLKWARERDGIPLESVQRYFPKIDQWEQGLAQPTYKQLERLAKKYKYPIAIFFSLSHRNFQASGTHLEHYRMKNSIQFQAPYILCCAKLGYCKKI